MVIDNGARVVVDNGNANAISTTGLGGNVISENENDKIIWNIGTNTGVYTIPYTTLPTVQGGNDVKIPLSMNITSAGTGTGRFELSTYETATDANTSFPSYVTNVVTPLQVVDRFWIIDAESYTTDPGATLSFTYDDNANELAGTNVIIEANLQAQRWNSTINVWELIMLSTCNPGPNTVTNVLVASTAFYEAWTLVDNLVLLPVTDLLFEATKVNRTALLEWSTSTEINTSHYDAMRSVDGYNWTLISEIEAAGNSQMLIHYSIEDLSPLEGINYYKINQYDQNGDNSSSEVRSLNFGGGNSLVYPNPFTDEVFIQAEEKNYSIQLIDPIGRIIFNDVNSTQIDVSHLEASCYFVHLTFQDGHTEVIKVVKQ
tara:strand:+ start:806 stop:1924 length:1119 start_codon:yes stop_codon:yes gene_type:complete